MCNCVFGVSFIIIEQMFVFVKRVNENYKNFFDLLAGDEVDKTGAKWYNRNENNTLVY